MEEIQQFVKVPTGMDGFLLEKHPKFGPIETNIEGVFIAGAAESPKDVRESVTQASAAASRASILLNKSTFSVEAITAIADDELCKKCGQCANVCPFGAITWKKKETAQVTRRQGHHPAMWL